MKNRRKWSVIIALIAAAAMVLSACGSGSSGSSDSNSSNSSGSSGSSGKVLVVYFSASGNTENVAKEIADDLDADLFEVTPKDPYSEDDLDWSNDSSRVVKEHEDESLQDVELKTTKVKNWDSYDTVFIGYPIWWGNAAWPINGFVKANDFTGKTVIPFCTSASSDIGESGTNLEEMTKGGDWQEGKRFEESPDMSEVDDWAESMVN
ncbi:MAG: flavodoxin [Anaerovoracaceae bacterium]|jgi:flavodoxin